MRYAKRKWIDMLVNAYYPYYVDQRVVLTRTGLSYPGWLKILNGSEMKVSTLIKICEAFNIPLDIAIHAEKEYLKVNHS
jgi:transcriptional regulator with XRE-family HTH domain